MREITIKDDLDGSTPAEEVVFTWEGVTWSLDLGDANRKKLNDALAPYLEVAHPAQMAQAATQPRRPRQLTGAAEKIDYTTPENAGNPHKGRVSPAEAEFVRENLGLVNRRLKAEGLREIDASDPKLAERYGL